MGLYYIKLCWNTKWEYQNIFLDTLRSHGEFYDVLATKMEVESYKEDFIYSWCREGGIGEMFVILGPVGDFHEALKKVFQITPEEGIIGVEIFKRERLGFHKAQRKGVL